MRAGSPLMVRKSAESKSGNSPRNVGKTGQETWSLTKRSSSFPAQLAEHSGSAKWRTIYGIGNRDILHRKCLGLICSVQCPGNVVIRTFDAIRSLRDAGIVVAGGFHSPMERECLDFLLSGEQPVIICPAKSPDRVRLAPAWRSALDAGRLLLVSPFGSGITRTTKAHAQTRNEFVAALSAAVLIPHATPGGNAAAAFVSKPNRSSDWTSTSPKACLSQTKQSRSRTPFEPSLLSVVSRPR